MTHEECRGLLALHALGSITGAERTALDRHVDGCPSCAVELSELAETAASLAWLARPMVPSPGHLHRVLKATRSADEAVRPAKRRPLVLAAVAAVVLLVLAQLASLRRLDVAEAELAAMRRMGRFVTSPSVTVVAMEGTRGEHAKVAYDRTNGQYVLLSSLRPPPPGLRYQLWVIDDGVRPASAFEARAPGGVLDARPRDGELFLFAVSLESTDTVTEPSGRMLLMSAPVRDPGMAGAIRTP
jgi:hypothetical protein